jgi:hypothetical protein
VTYGVFDELCGCCEVSPVELEGREGLLLDRPNGSWVAAGGGGAGGAAEVMHMTRWLRESELMRLLDDGVSMVGLTVAMHHGPALALNGAAERCLGAAPTFATLLGGSPILPAFALAM